MRRAQIAARALATLHRAGCLTLGLLALLPVVAFFVAGPPLSLCLLLAGLFLVSLARPEAGWLALVAVSPFGDLLGRLAGSRWSVTEPLVLVFLAAWLVRESARRADTVAQPAPPWLPLRLAGLFALAVTASLAVQLAVLQVSTAFPLDFARFVWRFLWHDYHTRPGDLAVVRGGAVLLQGIGLFAATVLVSSRRPDLIRRGARVTAGVAALVAAVNIEWFVQGWRAHGGTTLGELLALRVSRTVPDVNAAGSYFVMALFVAAGLVVSRRRRLAWIVVTLLVMSGLWLSGSRTAFLAAPLVLAAIHVALPRTGHLARRVVRVVFLCLAVSIAAYLVLNPRSAAVYTGTALRWRTEMSATALRMTREHPLFGVGPGRFYDLSYRYSDPAWRERTPHENAHNNFLQILAEVGAFGLLTLLALLAVVFRTGFRRTSGGMEGWGVGLTAGALAFVATWVAGHPLLTREVAVAFWLVLGLAATAASADEARRAASGRWRQVHPLLLAALMVCLVPVAALSRLAHADLTRDGRGFSQWHRAEDDTRFRWMLHRAVLYVPAVAREVAIGMRSPDGVATVRVLLDGKQAGQYLVGSGDWQEVRVAVPRDHSWASVPVTLQVRGVAPTSSAASGDPRIQVALPRVIR